MHQAQLFPFCGMNFAFRAQALPALYFPPMGEGSPFARFDDIWAGLVLQKALPAAGLLVTTGEPFVRHVRASDPFRNLVREAPGVEANELVWRLLRDAQVPAGDLAGAVAWLADYLRRSVNFDQLRGRPLTAYLGRWGDNLAAWLRVCQAVFVARKASLDDLGPGVVPRQLTAPDTDLARGGDA